MNDKVYADCLRLLAFEENEIPQILPDWRMAAEKLGLSKEDVEHATNEWIPQNWEVDHLGSRMAMGAFLREAIDLCKATEYKKRGVKIVYGILPAFTTNYLAIKNAGGDKVYVSFPDIFLVNVLNGLFHKIDPFLDAAETEGGIVYGCRHCALNKTRITARMKDVIPSPDVIWTWGFNCDEGPKTDEYINCYIDPNWEVEITRIPHDTHFGEEDDKNVERISYLAEQMKFSFNRVQEITGIKVEPEHISKAIKDWGRLAFKFGALQDIICKSDPVPFYAQLLALFQDVLWLPFNTPLTHIENATDITIKEGRQRVRDGIGILPKGSPKLGSYFVSPNVPWIAQLFKENGIASTFSLVVAVAERQLKPPSFEDPYMASGEQWLRASIGMNLGLEVEDSIQKVQSFKPDAMVMGFFDFDRWLGAHQKIMAKLVEERTGVPHFYLESDFWEDRDYSPEALRTRIESISQVIKMRKMETAGAALPA
jgi:hypothetical protein